ncbi:Rdx family-domain-containing protein [Apiospora rasikravindrae]|uniref:Rdx family-domain-containing protein n=1 Tax=Apiospora rasikravindrae TaxID=990691 RepID=A0ABR1UCC1_9PEZI
MAEITNSSSAALASDPAPSASSAAPAASTSASASASVSGSSGHLPNSVLPRVTIRFCTQCKWMLRAAYYAQELLSTFSTGLGEVALQPSTGGTFIVEILAAVNPRLPLLLASPPPRSIVCFGDRTVDGGFPETKELKRRVRDVIEPSRDLGHVDRDHARKAKPTADASAPVAPQESILTSSPSSSTPTIVRDTPRQGQSHPRMPVTEAGPPASATPGSVDGVKKAGEAVCEDCQ